MLRLYNLIATLIYDICNGLLVILESFFYSFKHLRAVETILIFRTGNLGDILCAIPAMRSLRNNFAKSKIILMTAINPKALNLPADILKNTSLYDRLIMYESKDLKKIKSILSLIHQIRNQRVDLLVYLSQSDASLFRLVRDMFFFRLAGCGRAYGFRLNKHRIFRIAQRYYRTFDREVERLMKIIFSLGISKSNVSFDLPIDDLSKVKIDSLLSIKENIRGVHRVAISPGSNMPVKCWPIENFIRLALDLTSKYNVFIIFLGDKKDNVLCQRITEEIKNNCLGLSGKTTIQEATEILRRCDFLISCDSGAVHLAASVGTPVIGIYTARDYPNCWYPWGDNHIVIRHDVKCQICLKNECLTMECIKGISAEEVFEACNKMLKAYT